MNDFVGKRLGDFEIVRELGRGGMGIVYEAQQLSLNRRVALKVMNAPLGLTPQGVLRFRREAEAAAKLHHTNIVPVYASGDEAGVPYYAMELIDGPSLDRVIRQLRHGAAETPSPTGTASTGPFSEGNSSTPTPGHSSHLSTDSQYFDRVARLCAGVADGLEHAHKNGVIHRDMKPSNLLVATDGRLTINDFGLARVLEQPGMTITGEFVGTPAYMSPEQITAGRTPLDHRTDIYSLGATLYEMLTLHPPFAGKGRDQVLAQIMHKEPKLPRRVNAKIPVDLETICLKALEKDPDRRYQSAGDMAEDLRRYLNRFAIVARRVGPIGRLRKWVKRHPALAFSLTGAILLAGLAGGLAYRYHLLDEQRQADQRRHDQEVRKEKLRAALDKALLLAMGGDFDAAAAEIAEAERLGVSEGELFLIRGQVAMHHGDIASATDNIKRAVELLPESVAAHSIYALMQYYVGGEALYLQELAHVERLRAITPEDFLFKGMAQQHYDRARALENVDEAVRRRPSAVGRMIRGRLRTDYLIIDNLTEEGAEKAVADALAAREAIPKNLPTIYSCLRARLAAVNACEAAGNVEKSKEHLARARDDARELGRLFPGQEDAVDGRFYLLMHVGELDTILEEFKQAAHSGPSPLTINYTIALYPSGRAAEAIPALEKYKGPDFIDNMRAFALAELPNDGPQLAYELYRTIAKRNPSGWDAYNSLFILYLTGRPDEAAAAARQMLRDPGRLPPMKPEQIRLPLRYMAGEIDADAFLRDATINNGVLCNAHFTVGMSLLSRGDRTGARKHFQACLATRVFFFTPYLYGWALLGRMQKDPLWPPWIGNKKETIEK